MPYIILLGVLGGLWVGHRLAMAIAVRRLRRWAGERSAEVLGLGSWLSAYRVLGALLGAPVELRVTLRQADGSEVRGRAWVPGWLSGLFARRVRFQPDPGPPSA